MACLAIVQVLRGLTHHVLEINRLDDIRVFTLSFLVHVIHSLYFLISCDSAVPPYRLVLELFLCVGVTHQESEILCMGLLVGLTFLGSVASCSPSFASFVSSEITTSVSSNLGLELRLVLLVLVSVPCCLLDFATVSVAYISSFSLTGSLIFQRMLSASWEGYTSSTSFLDALKEEKNHVCRCWDPSDQRGLGNLVLTKIAFCSLLAGMSCAWVILLTSASAADPFCVRGASEGLAVLVQTSWRSASSPCSSGTAVACDASVAAGLRMSFPSVLPTCLLRYRSCPLLFPMQLETVARSAALPLHLWHVLRLCVFLRLLFLTSSDFFSV